MWFGKHAEEKAHPELVQSVGRMLLTGMDFRGPQRVTVRYLWPSSSELTKAVVFYAYSQLHRRQSYLDYQRSSAGWSVYYLRSTILSLSKIPMAVRLLFQLRPNQETPAAALKNVAFEISQSQLRFFKCNFAIILISLLSFASVFCAYVSELSFSSQNLKAFCCK